MSRSGGHLNSKKRKGCVWYLHCFHKVGVHKKCCICGVEVPKHD